MPALALPLLLAMLQDAPAPLPEGNTYVRGLLLQHQRQAEELLDQYTYDVLAIREDLDAQGAVKKRTTRLYESFHVKGRRVQRKVAEDGRPLSPKDQAKEDREVQEKVEDMRAGRIATEEPGVRLSRVLERYDFRAVRREDVAGRPTLVLEFVPRPGKQDIEHDGVMRRLGGTVWVDDEDRQVVRAELRNLDTISIGAGIGVRVASLESRVAFQKVDGTVWFPAVEETVARGRVLLVKGFRTRFRREFSRFRRFEVTTEETPAR